MDTCSARASVRHSPPASTARNCHPDSPPMRLDDHLVGCPDCRMVACAGTRPDDRPRPCPRAFRRRPGGRRCAAHPAAVGRRTAGPGRSRYGGHRRQTSRLTRRPAGARPRRPVRKRTRAALPPASGQESSSGVLRMIRPPRSAGTGEVGAGTPGACQWRPSVLSARGFDRAVRRQPHSRGGPRNDLVCASNNCRTACRGSCRAARTAGRALGSAIRRTSTRGANSQADTLRTSWNAARSPPHSHPALSRATSRWAASMPVALPCMPGI